ncbi:MICOS complex subunit Mic60-like [Adelges cooleyi]|uniref:MICOS complex subunit Mic60-like n=1 Tax=Adelges cooleyi TaxID=133065 RepID=UPI00217F8659|nr:MICOS complex subunit Mic60-like [Adelges cooleyi]
MFGTQKKRSATQKQCEETASYQPPRRVFDKNETKDYQEIKEAPNLKTENKLKREQTVPASLMDAEKTIGELATSTIGSYTNALCSLRDYYSVVYDLVGESMTNVPHNTLVKLKNKGTDRERYVQQAMESGKRTVKAIKDMQVLLMVNSAKLEQSKIDWVKRNMQQTLEDIDRVRSEYDEEMKKLSVFNRAMDRVIDARQYFKEEIEKLSPAIDLKGRDLQVCQQELDQLVAYVVRKMFYNQMELVKAETVEAHDLKSAVESLRTDPPVGVEKAVDVQMANLKRKLTDDLMKEEYLANVKCESDVCQKSKALREKHLSQVEDDISKAERDAERDVRMMFSERSERNRLEFLEKVATMNAKLNGIDDALKDRAASEQEVAKYLELWTVCQSLNSAFNMYEPAMANEKHLKPLKHPVEAVRKASKGMPVISDILDTIPVRVIDRGAFPKEVLVSRFHTVAQKAHNMGLVNTAEPGLLDVALSHLLSFFVHKEPKAIPKAEIQDAPVDVSKMNTFDILQRARYWMRKNDFLNALKYMNLLDGGARIIADEWIEEMTNYLEAKQAVDVLSAYAFARVTAFTEKVG